MKSYLGRIARNLSINRIKAQDCNINDYDLGDFVLKRADEKVTIEADGKVYE